MKSFATAVLDNLFTVKSANVQFFDTFGSKIQRSFFMLVHEDDLPNLKKAIEDLPEKKRSNCVVHIRTVNNEYILTLVKLNMVKVNDDDLIEAYFIDILETEQMYYRTTEKYHLIKQHLMNMELLCFEYSPQTRKIEIFLYSLNQAITIYSGDFSTWKRNSLSNGNIIPEHITAFEAMCLDIESCNESFIYKLKSSVFTADDNVEENIIRCSSTTSALGNTYVVGTITNIINNSTIGVENTISHAYKDPMTGVLSKSSIIRFINNRIENIGDNENIVIAILDLDNFKMVNDTFGHLYGDKIIIRFAGIISRTIGNRGILGRFGGDEFMVMLENIKDEMELRSVLRAIRTNVEIEFKNIGDNISLTTSIGAATFPKDAKNYDELFTKADYCLYLSKLRGKNRYVMFDYMVKEHHYLNDKLLLKKEDASLDRITYTTKLLDMVIKHREPPILEMLALAGERYELSRIKIYSGKDLQLKYNWGTVAKETTFSSAFENRYLDAFDQNKTFIINYLSNIEISYPKVYDQLSKDNTLSAVQYLIGDKYRLKGIISFETTDATTHWTEDAIYNFTLIGYLLENAVFK